MIHHTRPHLLVLALEVGPALDDPLLADQGGGEVDVDRQVHHLHTGHGYTFSLSS